MCISGIRSVNIKNYGNAENTSKHEYDYNGTYTIVIYHIYRQSREDIVCIITFGELFIGDKSNIVLPSIAFLFTIYVHKP